MESAVQRFQRILDENNLTASLQDPQVRAINGGGVIVERPALGIVFTDPQKEIPQELAAEPVVEPIVEPVEEEVVNVPIKSRAKKVARKTKKNESK